MKRFLALALLFSVSGTALAAGIPSASKLSKLPSVRVLGVRVTPPSEFTSVQPFADLRIEVASCRELDANTDFAVETVSRGKILYVTIKRTDFADCRGLAVPREYEVQISSDFSNDHRVVVLNPVPAIRNVR